MKKFETKQTNKKLNQILKCTKSESDRKMEMKIKIENMKILWQKRKNA